MADERTRHLIRETLEEGLSQRRGRPVRIRDLERDPSSRSSSFQTERLRVTTDDDDTALRVYFKDLNPAHQVTPSWARRRTDRMPSRRELWMYEAVLGRARFGTPEFYGSRWEPERGYCWLFTEDVGDRMLQGEHDVGPWTEACRWAAGFHAATRDLPIAQTAFLSVYDEGHYRTCARQVERILPRLESSGGDVPRRALDYFTERIEWLTTLPRCVIHGQFFGQNIMLRAAAPRFAVIDWETAALGPRAFDLASITSNRRATAHRLAMQHAYLDQYRAESGQEVEAEGFEGEFVVTAVFHALQWLVWWSRHPQGTRRFAKHLRELQGLLDGQEERTVCAPRATAT